MSTPFDIAADPEGNPQPAPPEEPEPEVQAVEEAPPPPPRRKRGRPPRARPAPHTQAPAVEPRMEKLAAPPDGLPAVPQAPDPFDATPNEIPRDPSSMWTILRNQWIDSGRNIDDLQLLIFRTHVDGRPLPKAQPVPPYPQGSQFSGDSLMTAGEQLVDYIESVAHRDMGPAEYRVHARNRHTGKTVRTSEGYPLEPYREIMKRRADVDEANRRKMYGTPSYAASRGAVASPPPGGIPASPGMDPLTKHLLDTVLGQLNAANTRLAELQGQPPPPPVTMPAVGAAPVDPQEQFLKQLETQRRIAALLQPQQPAVSPQIMEVVTALRTEVADLKAKLAVAQAGPPAPPADSFQAWIEARKRDQDFEKIFRQRFPDYVHKDEVEARKNVYDPEAGPAPSKEFPLSTYMGEALRWVPWPSTTEGAPEAWSEWVARMAAENPRRAGDLFGGVLKVAASVLPMDKLSGLLEAMTKRGGQAAAAAAEHAATNGGPPAAGGWSPAT